MKKKVLLWQDRDWVNFSRELRSYGPTGTDTEDEAALPGDFVLASNYPNPFNPATTIRYALSKRSSVRLAVYDLQGRLVTVLIEAEQPAGRYEVAFEAGALPSGAYLYRLTAGSFSEARVMVLLR